MNRADFVNLVRFEFGDTDASNIILRESLTARPGNVIDGNNRIFFLLNRRIVETSVLIYNEENTPVPSTDYTLDPNTGKIVFAVPPKARLWVDYNWRKLMDAEINEAIKMAQASGGFNADALSDGSIDFAVMYTVAYCYKSASSRAAEYYTMSAGGKQVSKSELFNHFFRLFEKFLGEAQQLRDDMKQDRGDRLIPAEEECAPDAAGPYFPEDTGGF